MNLFNMFFSKFFVQGSDFEEFQIEVKSKKSLQQYLALEKILSLVNFCPLSQKGVFGISDQIHL